MGLAELCIAFTVFLLVVEGAIKDHEIDGTKLPGWNKPLPSKQYSGYIDLNQYDDSKRNVITKHLHYWFVESENDPSSDPVLLWMNGGPGCSSLLGYLNEMGPLKTDQKNYNKGEIPQLVYNKWTWTRMANMIFLETPVGVGYSYSEGSYKLDDSTSAEDNYQFLMEFFKSYSEYHSNDFYITGESYAGIYIPLLANRIMEKQDELTPAANKINLKGFAVGNGCIGATTGACTKYYPSKVHADYLYGHGLFPKALYQKAVNECNDRLFQTQNLKCKLLSAEIGHTIGRINAYGIFKGCPSNRTNTYLSKIGSFMPHMINVNLQGIEIKPKVLGPVDCLDDTLEKSLLNDPKTRSVLHVAPQAGEWAGCRYDFHTKYQRTATHLQPIYPKLIKKYKVLIYNGNTDSVVPYTADEEWTSSLGFEVKTLWKPWLIRNQVVGYVTEYNVNKFKFVVVHGAGHMVPEDKPEESFDMIKRFLFDEEF